MVLTVYFALSPVTGLFCHRRQRMYGSSAPGRTDLPSANLTPASGRQDHTTSPYAAIVARPRAVDRSQIFRPALRSPCAQNAAASTASLPAFVTMANAPLVGWDAWSSRCDLGGTKTGIFLQRGLDWWNQIDPVQQIRPCAQAAERCSFVGWAKTRLRRAHLFCLSLARHKAAA